MEARRIITNIFKKEYSQLVSVTPYIPTQDQHIDRSFILQQLGISKEQDDQMQQKYK